MGIEIGGFHELEHFRGKEFYEKLIGVNSGRNALLYILRARNVKKLYLPRFLCDCISFLCKKEGICYEEYSIGRDFCLFLIENYCQMNIYIL